MRRREFIAFVSGATLWPVVVHSQQHFKIGMLDTGIGTFFTVPFMSKLEELGFVEGKDLVVERRSAEGDNERLKEFAGQQRIKLYKPIDEADRIDDWLYLPETLYAFMLIIVVSAGAGPYSLDALILGLMPVRG